MDRISRRTLLKYLSASLGTVAAAKLLSACNPRPDQGVIPSQIDPSATGEVRATDTAESSNSGGRNNQRANQHRLGDA